MPRNWKLLRTIVAVFTNAWTICAKCSKRKLTFMISDQDKRLQVLAPNVATGKRPMLLQQIRGRPMTSDFKMIIGDERSTSLPENTFDKILIINSFHEFSFQAEMLTDIKKKLKAGGVLYIDEALPKRSGQLHGICNLPMLTNEETIAIFEKNGFEYINGIDFNYRQKVAVRKIFAFRIKE